MCDRKKHARGDSTPVTPTGEKLSVFLKRGESEADSDSSTTLVSGVTKKTVCRTCKKGFSFNAHRAICCQCAESFHFKCLNIQKEDFLKIEYSWLCPVCVVSSGGSAVDRQVAAALTAVDKPGVEITPNIGLVDILNEMKSFRLEIKETNKEFRNQLEKYSEWIVDNGKKIEEVGNKIEKAIEDIGFLRQENANLKKIVNDLSSKVNALEQSSKDNIVEISGVPHKEKEDILNIIGKISDAIGFVFKEDSVDNCYRYKSIDGSRPGIIVVRFVRKLDKEAFMNKRSEEESKLERHWFHGWRRI
ncbi:hypothetical protein J6590_085721, partial [Homalodisca vitripennis]